jgi:hypothetical protein
MKSVNTNCTTLDAQIHPGRNAGDELVVEVETAIHHGDRLAFRFCSSNLNVEISGGRSGGATEYHGLLHHHGDAHTDTGVGTGPERAES